MYMGEVSTGNLGYSLWRDEYLPPFYRLQFTKLRMARILVGCSVSFVICMDTPKQTIKIIITKQKCSY